MQLWYCCICIPPRDILRLIYIWNQMLSLVSLFYKICKILQIWFHEKHNDISLYGNILYYYYIMIFIFHFFASKENVHISASFNLCNRMTLDHSQKRNFYNQSFGNRITYIISHFNMELHWVWDSKTNYIWRAL